MIGLPYRTYYQLFPNRCIVGALFVVLLALCIKLEKPRLLLAIGYILTIFMFVWSNDCGLFMIVSWAAYLVCRSFSSSIKSCLWKIPLIIAMIPVSIAASFGLTNLYNIAVGGKPMDFETFMFPIIGTSHIKNKDIIQVFEKKAKTTISRTICSYVALMAVVIMVFVNLSCIINISSRQNYFVSGANESSCDYIVI